jgi:hypothetical protein
MAYSEEGWGKRGAWPRHTPVEHAEAESSTRPAARPLPPAPFVPRSSPARSARSLPTNDASAMFIFHTRNHFFPLCRFRGESTGPHHTQRKPAAKVAGNLVLGAHFLWDMSLTAREAKRTEASVEQSCATNLPGSGMPRWQAEAILVRVQPLDSSSPVSEHLSDPSSLRPHLPGCPLVECRRGHVHEHSGDRL